jgi:hypothetical protein
LTYNAFKDSGLSLCRIKDNRGADMFKNISSVVYGVMLLLFFAAVSGDVSGMKNVMEAQDCEWESSFILRLKKYRDPVNGASAWIEDAEFFSSDEFLNHSNVERAKNLFNSFSVNTTAAHNYAHAWPPSDRPRVLLAATKLWNKICLYPESYKKLSNYYDSIERAIKRLFDCQWDPYASHSML